jgi:hypothetical protein
MWSWIFILALFLCRGPVMGYLHAQMAGGNVSGIVTDPSGASIPRAAIVVRRIATRVAMTVNANGEGFYAAWNLVPGEYEVAVSAAGFETQIARLTLLVGSEEELNFAMRIGSVDQTLEVKGPSAGIDLAMSALGAAVD